ncbi:MAG: methyltransferase domain-containing protein [Pseudomonadales bacterium]|nr:methyltransferase domain-containing protein [Pseudomonadales bacterium]
MQALACPLCFSSLTELRCSSCAITYSQLGDLFWLWPDPVNALLDWRNRYNMELARIDRDFARAQATDSTFTTTRARVAVEQSALEQYKTELSKILGNLNLSEPLAVELHTALKTQLPDHHGLNSYNRNIFRDWVWGTEENEAVQQLLIATLSGHVKSAPDILTLGSGAGRLAYDLHTGLNARCTYALDSNPLLCAVAGRMFKGESSSLTEFPIAPLGATAIQHTLQTPPVRNDIHSICGNALAAPFSANQLDLVLTSWLVDVLDASLSDLLAHVSSLLKPGGLWLMHGSVSFESSDPSLRLSTAELAEVATEEGFEIIAQRDDELPYLQSPYSRQKRTEVVHTLLARAPSPRTTRPVQATWMPNWLADISVPVPMNDEFQEQLTTTRIATFIMGLIDGKKSIADMAVVLEEQRLMPILDATEAIRNFLTTMQAERTAQQRKG